MREMETEMKTRVRRGGKSADRITGNMVWTDFTHFTTRPVDGVPDPDLHAHCFAFNVTWDAEEDRWKAGQFGDLKRDAAYYEAAFHARLAARIKMLGYGIERHGKWWDVAGVPRELIEKFSRRSASINAKAAEAGITDAGAKSELGARTRERKALDLSMSELKTAWWNRLTPEERALLENLAGGEGPRGGPGVTPQAALAYAVEDVYARASVVSEKQLYEKALRRGFGHVLPEDLSPEAEADPRLIRSEAQGRTLVTTREMLKGEQAIIERVKRGRGTLAPLNRDAEAFCPSYFNREQRNAVRHLLTAGDAVTVLRGGAGTGKTTVLREVRQGIRAAGRDIVAVAPSASASRGTLREAGYSDATTVEALLSSEVMQHKLGKAGVLLVDEAGQLDVRSMDRVLRLAQETGARVILAGDTRQHGPVAAGDALRLIETYTGVKVAELSEIVRQQGAYKAAAAAIQDGDIARGFAQLDRLGWIHEVSRAERHVHLVQDYMEAVDRGRSALVIAPTHREGDAVTQQIRKALQASPHAASRLGAQEHVYWTLQNLSWTDAEKSDAAQYHQGLVVQFVKAAPGIRRGDRFEVHRVTGDGEVIVAGRDGRETMLPLADGARFQVYRKVRLHLAVNERIRITQNGFTEDGHRLNNGDLRQIRDFTEDRRIILDNGWILGADFGHLAHGYVLTSYASQSKTVDVVLAAMGPESLPAMDAEQAYVTVTRGRHEAHLYVDDKEAVARRIQQSGRRGTATELVEGKLGAAMQPVSLHAVRRAKRERYQRYLNKVERIIEEESPEPVHEPAPEAMRRRTYDAGPQMGI
jgi:ATP-dependent exoDNAse (exonuclease V) alpha subunit